MSFLVACETITASRADRKESYTPKKIHATDRAQPKLELAHQWPRQSLSHWIRLAQTLGFVHVSLILIRTENIYFLFFSFSLELWQRGEPEDEKAS